MRTDSERRCPQWSTCGWVSMKGACEHLHHGLLGKLEEDTWGSGDQFELHFISNDQIELKSMEGKTTCYRRAPSYAPSADDLKAFAGRYGNDENKVVFEMTPSTAGLTARVSWNASQPFEFVRSTATLSSFAG
jgi:hypothetical protein